MPTVCRFKVPFNILKVTPFYRHFSKKQHRMIANRTKIAIIRLGIQDGRVKVGGWFAAMETRGQRCVKKLSGAVPMD